MKWSTFHGAFGAATGLVGVAAGAFGAHALRASLAPDLLAAFDTGARYQVIHALALVAVALADGRGSPRWLRWAGASFAIGQLIFPGSLYALALSGARAWGAITPLGGLCYLVGWLALGLAFAREGVGER